MGDYSAERGARAGDGVLCVQVHGDGAFTGQVTFGTIVKRLIPTTLIFVQGVVWESIALSQSPHFRVGGSIHLVTNNQVCDQCDQRGLPNDRMFEINFRWHSPPKDMLAGRPPTPQTLPRRSNAP